MTIALATAELYGKVLIWSGGNSDDDNDVVVQTNDVLQYNTFLLMSTAGVLDVLVSLDGTNYATVTLSLTDLGASSTAPVKVTVAARIYGFRGYFSKIRVLQNAGTDTEEVTLICGRDMF